MGLESRDYMRDVPIYRRLVGRDGPTAGGGAGDNEPPTRWAHPPREPEWWRSRSSGRRTYGRKTRPWAWFLLGVVTTLGAVGYVVERGVPVVGDSSTVEMAPLVVPARTATARAPVRIPIDGPEKVAVGTTVSVKGTFPLQDRRVVVVKGRWNGGPWLAMQATDAADDGSFRVRYKLDKRGTAQVRIMFPGGSFAYKWYRVS